MTPQPQYTEWLIRVLVFLGGVGTTVVGSWVSSKIRVYHDHRKAHLEDLQQKVLVPIREGLDRHFQRVLFIQAPMLFVQTGVTTHFDFKAKAAEEQTERGDVLVAAYPAGAIFSPLDSALLEDAKGRHFNAQFAMLEQLLEDWTAHASRCHSWAMRLSQEILTRSGLPAFPARGNQPAYVMHFRLAVFVYKRLFRLQAPALRAEEMYPGPHWILNGEGCTSALGTKEQIEGLVTQIDQLLDSEQATALDIQNKLTELQREFQALIPRLDHAIAVRRLRKRCDLVPFF